ncbi:MAG: hypothetical protein MMC23_009113 [Stictis urceolatum]|nr:hypothetical protein [Stictis urceolata]
MATSASSDLGVENTNITTAPGVTLSEQQNTLVGSILDLFAGRPSLRKLSLWEDSATFEDPITIAAGREKYAPQWYGLQSVFSNIERLSHTVTSAGNPITMNMRTRYVVKGISKEQTIDSKIEIFVDEKTGKITRVNDKWDGKMPDSTFRDSLRKLNSVTVPKLVSVPKTEEEDRQRLEKH